MPEEGNKTDNSVGSTAPDNLAGKDATTQKPEEPNVLVAVVDINEKPKEQPTKFNFIKPNVIPEEVSKPTTSDPKPDFKELQKKLIEDEGKSASQLTLADFEENADFAIDFVDFLTTALFRWISLDNTDTPYEMPKPKIEKLKRQFTRVLIRYNKAMPIIGLFLGTLGAACITPARKAIEHNKLVREERAKRKTDEKTPEVNPLKRGRGQPRK